MSESLGGIIDNLALDIELGPDQMITDAIVLAKVTDLDTGAVTMISRYSSGISWMERVGMLRSCEQMELSGLEQVENDD